MDEITPDDPRLTAYAFGELEGEENAMVVAAVTANPALRQVVDEIHQTGIDLSAALASEPLPEADTATTPVPQAPASRTISFPFWLTAGSLAAASLAVMVFVNQNNSETTTVGAFEKSAKSLSEEEPSSPSLRDLGEASKNDATPEGFAAHRANPPPPQTGVRDANTAPTHAGGFVEARVRPVSRPGLTVETTSYTNVRRAIRGGQLPPPESIRIEELLAAFRLKAGSHTSSTSAPLFVSSEVADAPWAPMHRLVFITIDTRDSNNPTGSAGGTVARDVRLEIEFNPAHVRAYRLITENEGAGAGPAGNFGNPAGPNVRSNQTIGALYEIIPATTNSSPDAFAESSAPPHEIARLNIGYALPDDAGREFHTVSLIDEGGTFPTGSRDLKFATAVASFGMILSHSPFIGSATLGDVAAWAQMGAERDPDGERTDFLDLVRDAQRLQK